MPILSKLTYGLIIALLVAVAGVGVQTVRLANEQADHAKTIANHEKDLATLTATAAQAALDNLAEYQRRAEGVQKEAENAKRLQDKALVDAVNSAIAGERLRAQRKAALAESCGKTSTDPATSDQRQTTDAALDMFDNVQQRLDEATDTIAEYADQAAIAGRACENSYNVLRTGAKSGVIDETPLNINQALNRQLNEILSPNLQEITP